MNLNIEMSKYLKGVTDALKAVRKSIEPQKGMADKEFLQWVHDRLEFVHGENRNVDYMHKLRAVIRATDVRQITTNTAS